LAPTLPPVLPGEDSYVRIEGLLDEELDVAKVIASRLTAPIIDMDRVTRVTSAGIRKWTSLVPQISPFWLINCRPAVVSALNIVRQFAAGGHVVSIYAPYLCVDCRHSFDEYMDLRSAPADWQSPEVDCPACGKKATFDEIASEYFAYVQTHPVGPVPMRVGRLLDAPSHLGRTGSSERLREARVRMADVHERLKKMLDRDSE
jgi:hypothetical protein